jgi:hypothetical protein
MTSRLALFVTVVSLVPVGKMTCAEESAVREMPASEAGENSGATREAVQTRSIDVASLRPGARVEIRTAPVVDWPSVVTMRFVDGSLETALRGRIVAQSRHTLTLVPQEGTLPVTVAKPDTKLVAVVVGVESGVLRLDLESREEQDVVMLPMTAVARLTILRTDALASGLETMDDLVGAPVIIAVGDAVDTQRETGAPRSPAPPDVVIDGGTFREVPVAGQQRPVLLPVADSAFAGKVETVADDVLTVRLFGRSQVVTVPRAAITSLEVKRKHSQAGKGALVGAGVGLAISLGTVLYSEAGHHCVDGGEDPGLCTFLYVAGTVVATAGGALIGAVSGALTPRERWERVDTQRLRVSVMPDPHGGIRGGLSVRF